MIVKNESTVLARCLDSIKDLVDEMIIVDTGSTDNTKKIAASYTDQIYDYEWCDDFAAARNFSFSKATMEYIYIADADEMLDEKNRIQFMLLKNALLPEVEIVQMLYRTVNDNTVLNCQEEHRPKLFRRLREFTWIDPIHEVVRMDPVVFDSDICVLHMPQGVHSGRDFSVFQKAFAKTGVLSARLHTMYARELFISGSDADFETSASIFTQTLMDTSCNSDMQKEAACVLAHLYRIRHDADNFFKLGLKDMLTDPCAECCFELGEWYYAAGDYMESIMWFYNAAFETASILDIHRSGDLPLARLADCYEKLSTLTDNDALIYSYAQNAADYRQQADAWELPTQL